eukprot:2497250-Pleurochrysis_carterae.AAC.2
MRPKRKQDVAPRPASRYNVLRQVQRVHLRAGRDMVKAEHLRRAVDGLQEQFVVLHGHEALLPRRKFPMSNALFHRLIASSAMPEAPLLRASLLATLCPLYVSGFRKAELIAYTCRSGRPGSRAPRSSGCEVSSRQNKCDATDESWGRHTPIALAYADVPGNAAKALAHLELAFADNATPLTPSQADKLLASLLADCLCPDEASRHS